MSRSPKQIFNTVFGHLTQAQRNRLLIGFSAGDAWMPDSQLWTMSQGFDRGYSALDVYIGLEAYAEGLSMDRHLEGIHLGIAHSMLNPERFDVIFADLVRNYDLLVCPEGSDKRYPEFSEAELALMANRGISLVRDAAGNLRSKDDLAVFAGTKKQAFSFVGSAILNDDPEGYEYLKSIPSMRKLISHTEVIEFVDSIINAERDLSVQTRVLVEPLLPLTKVEERLFFKRHMKDYWLALTAAFSNGDSKAVEKVFDRKLSGTAAKEILVQLLSDKSYRQGQQRFAVMKYITLHQKSGADMAKAFYELAFSPVEALDFVGVPVDPDLLVERALSADPDERVVFAPLLLMFTTDQLLGLQRGQQCLQALYELTQDMKYMELVNSLEFKSKEFISQLGI